MDDYDILDTYLDQSEVNGIYAQMPDGTLMEVEVDGWGHIIPVKKYGGRITAPPPPTGLPTPSTSTSDPDDDLFEEDSAEAPYVPGKDIMGSMGKTLEDLLGKLPEPPTSAGKPLEEVAEEASKSFTIGPGTLPPIGETDRGTYAVPPSMKDTVFNARLQSIMTDNKYDRRVRGRRKGKLDMTRLWKVEMGSESVFTQKIARRGKLYNIVLVVDVSGSMGSGSGSRLDKAAEVATFLAKHFEGLNINLAIISFNLFIYMQKDFDQKVGDYSQLHKNIMKSGEKGGNYNNDYDALAEGFKMLSDRTEGENLLVLISDGAPATRDSKASALHPWTGKTQVYQPTYLDAMQKDQKKHLHALIKSNESRSHAFAIGIESDSWQVPDHIKAPTLDQLKPMVLDSIRRHVKRG
jgi:hypothetical protein